MTQEALKLALEFVKSINLGSRSASVEQQRQVITALEEALAQTQEPDVQETLHWHAFNYRQAHTAQAHEMWQQLEQFVDSKIKAPQRTWVGLTDEQLRTEFGKLYPNDIGILELAENNRDFAVEAIGARHHWVAFQAGARAAEAKLKEKNT